MNNLPTPRSKRGVVAMLLATTLIFSACGPDGQSSDSIMDRIAELFGAGSDGSPDAAAAPTPEVPSAGEEQAGETPTVDAPASDSPAGEAPTQEEPGQPAMPVEEQYEEAPAAAEPADELAPMDDGHDVHAEPEMDAAMAALGLSSDNMVTVDPGDYLVPTPVPATLGRHGVQDDGGNMGVFRINCKGFVKMGRIDPIVTPGVTSHHVHTFFGNYDVNVDSNFAQLREQHRSNCNDTLDPGETDAQIRLTRGSINVYEGPAQGDDASGYWAPTLVDTATGKPVPMITVGPAAEMYYDHRFISGPDEEIDYEPFAAGFFMVAGTPMRNPELPAESGVRHHWDCRGENNERQTSTALGLDTGHTIPICSADTTMLRMSVSFPNCWNGVMPVAGVDFTSHVAYSAGKPCPVSHPRELPGIQLNINYDITGLDTSTLRLTSDMYDTDLPGGYSAHADFFNGWRDESLAHLVDTCLDGPVSCR